MAEKIGIYSETEPLKKVAVWGELGSEAVLAQLYPVSISLFFDNMDVVKARTEASIYATQLRSFGVEVYQIRDELAKLIPVATLTKTMVTQMVWAKAKEIEDKFGIVKPDTYDVINYLIEQDCEKYGEEKAAALNMTLSVQPPLPLGNILYSRDQMNVLLGTMFQSRMAKDIRKPEVELYNLVYKQVLGLPNPTEMPNGETFEGGDAYIHDKVVYVGASPRTSLGAAVHIFKYLQPQLEELGFGFAVVYDPDAHQRSVKDQMDFMHLDTFSMPLSAGNILLCAEEAQRRKIFTVSHNHGSLQVTDTGLSFLSFLEKQAQEIRVISLKEQQFFGCNFLNLDPNRLIMPIENNITNGTLKGSGKEIILADLSESTKGYGGAHCMTGQLVRCNIN